MQRKLENQVFQAQTYPGDSEGGSPVATCLMIITYTTSESLGTALFQPYYTGDLLALR